jgi:hypothetical protein
MVIGNDSYLQYTANSSIQSLKDYFKTIHETYNISIEKNETNFVEASIKLAGFLGSISQTKSTRLKFSKISGQSKNIFIGSQPKDIELFGNNLYVTPAGIDFLISKLSPLLPFSSISIDSYNNFLSDSAKEISFEDLGFENRVMIGIGDLTASYPFSLQEIGGWPKHLFCTLVYNHTPVGEEERSFLKIKMNKTLLETREVTGQGGEKSISFKFRKDIYNPKIHWKWSFHTILIVAIAKEVCPKWRFLYLKIRFYQLKDFAKTLLYPSDPILLFF